MYHYLSSPYSDPTPGVEDDRAYHAAVVTGRLIAAGFTIYSPIVHCRPLAALDICPASGDFWEKHNNDMIASAYSLILLMAPGSIRSKGMAREKAFAETIGLPVHFLSYELSARELAQWAQDTLR